MSKVDGGKVYIQLQQLKEMRFSKSHISRQLEIIRPTFNRYYDLNIDEYEELLQSMTIRVKKADQYHDWILNYLKEYSDIKASEIYYWIQEKTNGDPDFSESSFRNYIRDLMEDIISPRQRIPDFMRLLKIHQWVSRCR